MSITILSNNPRLYSPLEMQLMDTIWTGMAGKNVQYEITTFVMGVRQMKLTKHQVLEYFLQLLRQQPEIMLQMDQSREDFVLIPPVHDETDDVVTTSLWRQLSELAARPIQCAYKQNDDDALMMLAVVFPPNRQLHIVTAGGTYRKAGVFDYKDGKVIHKNTIDKKLSRTQMFLGTLVDVLVHVFKQMDSRRDDK